MAASGRRSPPSVMGGVWARSSEAPPVRHGGPATAPSQGLHAEQSVPRRGPPYTGSPMRSSTSHSGLSLRGALQQVPMLDATSWAKLRGTPGANATAALTQYKTQGRLFSVSEGRRELYPQFQFDDHAAPLPVMADILHAVPADACGWPLLSWFNAGNVLLGGRKPLEVIRQDPEAVQRAATDYYLQDD